MSAIRSQRGYTIVELLLNVVVMGVFCSLALVVFFLGSGYGRRGMD